MSPSFFFGEGDRRSGFGMAAVYPNQGRLTIGPAAMDLARSLTATRQARLKGHPVDAPGPARSR
jgi:hypothetical protein